MNVSGPQRNACPGTLTQGVLYNFFPSKEAFAAEVIDAYSHRGQERLRRYLLNQNVTR